MAKATKQEDRKMWLSDDMSKNVSEIELKDIMSLESKEIREGPFLDFKLNYGKRIESTICAYMDQNGV